jgi:hypothetical protein
MIKVCCPPTVAHWTVPLDMLWQPAGEPLQPTRGASVIDQSLDIYFQSFYPMFPILNQARVRSAVPGYLARRSQPDSGTPETIDRMLDSILALIECRDHGADRGSAPHFARVTTHNVDATELDTLSIDSVMCRLHIFVCYQSLGQRLAAWYHLQEAMTLMLMLGQPDWTPDVGEEHLRLYWVL